MLHISCQPLSYDGGIIGIVNITFVIKIITLLHYVINLTYAQ